MAIALDGMGGDFAPQIPVKGAVLAAQEFNEKIYLIGPENILKKELEKYSYPSSLIEIVDAPDIVTMDEKPSVALRKKKNSSIHIGAKLVKDNLADAFVSAGNTGAVMAICTFILKILPGISRPAITAILPNLKGKTVLLDVGANVDCKSRYLVEFALMGEAYARYALNLNPPRVGILNIGEEKTKGNELTKDTYKLLEELKKHGFPFFGNAEGRDVYSGKFDVIVCDGFVGNVALKMSESLAKIVLKILKEEIKKSFLARLGSIFLKPAFKSFKRRTDYAQWGGAPLLGLNYPVIIAHGSSNEIAIKNAILRAKELKSASVNDHILKNIEKYIPILNELCINRG